MKVRDLIEQLQNVDGDSEVRLAVDRHSPTERDLGAVHPLVLAVDANAEFNYNLACAELDRLYAFADADRDPTWYEMESAMRELRRRFHGARRSGWKVVYLAESIQIGSLPEAVRTGLNW